jgi:hypothetical protein
MEIILKCYGLYKASNKLLLGENVDIPFNLYRAKQTFR